MSTLECPKDGRTCPDDVCRGSVCVETGTRMWERCSTCGVAFDPDIDCCDCDRAYEDYDEAIVRVHDR